MKKILFTLVIFSVYTISFAQTKDAIAVKQVLKEYQNKIEKLDTTGISNLFGKNSSIFEGGSSEGTIAHYLEHHLGPELKEFSSFKFNNYKVDVQVDSNYAFANEVYSYIIVTEKNKTEVKRNGVATSVLKKVGGMWKITNTHSSSRK